MSWILLVFVVIAMVYASVGFGGGSGYLALLSTTSMDHEEMRFIALCCNILVVTTNCVFFYKEGLLKFRKFFPLILLSIPMSMLGGYITLQAQLFFIVLGAVLLTASLLMLVQVVVGTGKEIEVDTKTQQVDVWKSTGIGGAIGLISGLVGIGGGIFLAPWLYLTRWDSARHIAAASSFFILVNSAAGLIGQSMHTGFRNSMGELLWYLVAVAIGSILGAGISLKWLRPDWVKALTAVLVLLAAVRILIKNL